MDLKEQVTVLKSTGEVRITHKDFLVEILESSNGFDGNIFNKKEYMENNGIEPIDGGIFEGSEEEAIQFFLEAAEEL